MTMNTTANASSKNSTAINTTLSQNSTQNSTRVSEENEHVSNDFPEVSIITDTFVDRALDREEDQA